jgi:predicted alpha/beta-hydrolase family hydrolase
MSALDPRELKIAVGETSSVSALLMLPPNACACFVFAHGAGAGMRHKFMAEVAEGLAGRGVATLRYQFPYMEKASKRPDPPAVAHAAVRAAVASATEHCPGLPLIAGGKSFGARMTSQAQAKTPLAGVRGLAFLGFPLHPAGKPSSDRADHLGDVKIPMLFLQGTNDKLAELGLLKPLAKTLGARATLHLVEAADHSFHVPVRSGRRDSEVMADVLDVFVAWSAEKAG